jgi:Xaa-Pro aminopeptidase
MKKLAFLSVWAVLSVSAVFGQDLEYLVYDRDLSPPEEYQHRRTEFMNKLPGKSAAIFYAASEHTRTGDTDFPFRQDNNILYFTGFSEPNSILLLAPDGIPASLLGDTVSATVNEILFVMRKERWRETWSGRQFGPEGTEKFTNIECATTNDKFAAVVAWLSRNVKKLCFPPVRSDVHGALRPLLEPLQKLPSGGDGAFGVEDPTNIVRSMRQLKSAEEIRLIRRATQISVAAHRQAMMSCVPGMHEYELKAVYEYVFRKLGAESPAYPCIIGSGENSVVMHYAATRRQMKDGDVVVADCGAEYHNYASDVTRTYPVNGKFSAPQREIYEIVLCAQDEALQEIKPGVPFSNAGRRAKQVIQKGLLRLGILKDTAQIQRFYPHNLGHPVGLDVHDGSTPILKPGVVHTLEPGIYIAEDSPGVDPRYLNIGVRIEDMVLVTESGYELLSSGLPRTPAEIERLMKKEGLGNRKVE